MNKSFSYYVVLFVIKIKGIKKTFSESPIDYLQLRKTDIYTPTSNFYKTDKISTFSVLKTQITQITNSKKSDKLLIYLHGGAFVSGPTEHHWKTIAYISKKTKYTIWMCNYPKAPENKIEEISANIDLVYQKALSKYNSDAIVVMGDSAGGTLAIAFTQRLVLNKLSLPSKLVVISPVLDASFKNEKIIEIENKDPMLSKAGVMSAKNMCSDNVNDVRISPINGDFKFFPKTFLYLAENDITFPDQLLLLSKLNQEKIDIQVNIGHEMPHIWPLLPTMKEAKMALDKIINNLNE